jgi:hypothetical protein
MAVGHSFGSGERTLAESWDGSAWSLVPSANGGDTTNVLISNVLNDVSCISAQACTAVGEYVGPGGWQTLIESWDGSAWSIVPSPNSSPSLGNYLDGVSCLSATFCTAVGSFISGHGDETLVESWDGSTWSIVPSPDTGYIDGLLKVSCTSPSACTAVGESRPRFAFDRTLVETWDGKAWSVVASPDASTSTNLLNDVSCPTAAQCVAVGTFFNGNEYQLLSMSWDGSSWSLLPNPGLNADGTGVTCGSATDCTEVGASGLVNTWDGKTWTLVPTPASPDPVRRLNAISCLPSSVCMAVGYFTETGVSHTFTEEGCNGAAPVPPGPQGGHLRADTVPAGPSCPLDVFVKVLEPLRSGLAIHSLHYNEFPVDFVAAPSQSEFRCESGCVDVIVTVVDHHTHKPVEGATVNASVSGITHVAGEQYLCAATADGHSYGTCGDYVLGLKTDEKGHVYLRYWAPGVDEVGHTTLSVTAKITCNTASCPLRQKRGSAKVKLTVSPYLVYQRTAPLSEEEAVELAAWAGGTGFFTRFLHATVAGPKVLSAALTWLKAAELFEEKVVEGLEVVEKVEPIVGVIEVFQAFTELWERESMISMFLQTTKLSPTGLGEPAIEAWAHAAPSKVFATHLVNYGVVVPFNLGADGAWWDIATVLRHLQAADEAAGKKPDMSNWQIRLKVFELSTCDPAKGDCAPGYVNDPGTTEALRPGIQPELEFYISLLDNAYNRAHTARELYKFDTYNFTVPYDAIAWAEAQGDKRGVITDFK